ncbi:MAG TPA: hypothetical protein VKF59_13200, partial [Candidatus Dormibacteraeota bacterium]|nr:hypothetical protein [Candidatus Dormibacteraeota bacterium]
MFLALISWELVVGAVVVVRRIALRRRSASQQAGEGTPAAFGCRCGNSRPWRRPAASTRRCDQSPAALACRRSWNSGMTWVAKRSIEATTS